MIDEREEEKEEEGQSDSFVDSNASSIDRALRAPNPKGTTDFEEAEQLYRRQLGKNSSPLFSHGT